MWSASAPSVGDTRLHPDTNELVVCVEHIDYTPIHIEDVRSKL